MPKEMTVAAILLSAVLAGVPQIKPDAGERWSADLCDRFVRAQVEVLRRNGTGQDVHPARRGRESELTLKGGVPQATLAKS
jgi:hypothetical protein